MNKGEKREEEVRVKKRKKQKRVYVRRRVIMKQGEVGGRVKCGDNLNFCSLSTYNDGYRKSKFCFCFFHENFFLFSWKLVFLFLRIFFLYKKVLFEFLKPEKNILK